MKSAFPKTIPRPLELASRRRIYDAIKKFAGSHFREIQRKSALSVGSARHHLNALIKSGLVKEEKRGANLVYFTQEVPIQDTKLLALLREQSVRKILLIILDKQRCNHEQIIHEVFLSPSTISWHIKKLQQAGIIKSEKIGRKTFYQLDCEPNRIVNILITYQESFVDSLVDRIVDMWTLE